MICWKQVVKLFGEFIIDLYLINVEMNFYIGKEKVKSGQDLDEKNVSQINSIFQITNTNENLAIYLDYCEIKEKLCPLVFKNSNIDYLIINCLTNTFYKKNIMQFENPLFRDLGLKISALELKNISIGTGKYARR